MTLSGPVLITRKTDAAAFWDLYRIQHKDKCIQTLGEATTFSKLDASSRYEPLDIVENDWDKKTFTAHHGIVHFKGMPFWSEPHMIDLTSSGCIAFETQGVLLLLSLSTPLWNFYQRKLHLDHVPQFLTLLHEACMTLNGKQCVLFFSLVNSIFSGVGLGKGTPNFFLNNWRNKQHSHLITVTELLYFYVCGNYSALSRRASLMYLGQKQKLCEKSRKS